ncbi:hypothetical protein JTE90_020767 [Oedothorax gibbosus]|uniref:Uncharacterized protein n=1 Tax=Oedothorax gibbosus TaxID=931172 RepID=A0AAV6TQU3_9ARAC|nr:hypothetical protein JTE90_020767 [Oedothorax gibbosus]
MMVDNWFKLLTSKDQRIQQLAWGDLLLHVKSRTGLEPTPSIIEKFLNGIQDEGFRHTTCPYATTWSHARSATTSLGASWRCKEVYDIELHVEEKVLTMSDRTKICRSIKEAKRVCWAQELIANLARARLSKFPPDTKQALTFSGLATLPPSLTGDLCTKPVSTATRHGTSPFHNATDATPLLNRHSMCSAYANRIWAEEPNATTPLSSAYITPSVETGNARVPSETCVFRMKRLIPLATPQLPPAPGARLYHVTPPRCQADTKVHPKKMYCQKTPYLLIALLSDAGVKLHPGKCEFLKSSVEYLGHGIDRRGLHPVEAKLQAIEEASSPKNIEELRIIHRSAHILC